MRFAAPGALPQRVQQRLDGLANRIDAATTARLFDQVTAQGSPPAADLAAYLIERASAARASEK